jgi:hypothetical protein
MRRSGAATARDDKRPSVRGQADRGGADHCHGVADDDRLGLGLARKPPRGADIDMVRPVLRIEADDQVLVRRPPTKIFGDDTKPIALGRDDPHAE